MIAPMTTAGHVLLVVLAFVSHRTSYAMTAADPGPDDVLKHPNLLPDHLADGHYGPAVVAERRV